VGFLRFGTLQKTHDLIVSKIPIRMNQKQDSTEDSLSEQFQRLLIAIEASGHAVLPKSHDALLKSIVEAAGRIFGAQAASILLVNYDEQVLEFKVAYGPSNRDLIGERFPLDKGIAGYVVMTGQAIGTSNVRQDARFNQDFAKSTGYIPNSILATPLLSHDRIIGVMEVLDKIDATSFDMQDMELLGMFARQAALAIDQSQQIENIKEALVLGLKRLAAADPAQNSAEIQAVLEKSMGKNNQITDLLELADLFNDISVLGESERKVCMQVLESFAAYRRSLHKVLK
jgi:GAF domain-containing protein